MSERLLVCGSRRWTDESVIDQQIRLARDGLELVIEGEAPGADILARRAAERHGVPVLRFPAAWGIHAPGWCRCPHPGTYCPSAGRRRNRQMLDEGKPTVVVAFTDDFENPRSGTRHMCRIAVTADIPTTLVEHGVGGCRSRDLTAEDFRRV